MTSVKKLSVKMLKLKVGYLNELKTDDEILFNIYNWVLKRQILSEDFKYLLNSTIKQLKID